MFINTSYFFLFALLAIVEISRQFAKPARNAGVKKGTSFSAAGGGGASKRKAPAAQSTNSNKSAKLFPAAELGGNNSANSASVKLKIHLPAPPLIVRLSSSLKPASSSAETFSGSAAPGPNEDSNDYGDIEADEYDDEDEDDDDVLFVP